MIHTGSPTNCIHRIVFGTNRDQNRVREKRYTESRLVSYGPGFGHNLFQKTIRYTGSCGPGFGLPDCLEHRFPLLIYVARDRRGRCNAEWTRDQPRHRTPSPVLALQRRTTAAGHIYEQRKTKLEAICKAQTGSVKNCVSNMFETNWGQNRVRN